MADDDEAHEPAKEGASAARRKRNLPEWMRDATSDEDAPAGFIIVGGFGPVDPDTLLPIGRRSASAPDRPEEPGEEQDPETDRDASR